MCHYKKLFCCNDGYVLHCAECNVFHIAFYTTLITLSEKNFYYIGELLEERLPPFDSENISEVKAVYLPSPVDGFGFTLTIHEAYSLLGILNLAIAKHKTDVLLKSLEINVESSN